MRNAFFAASFAAGMAFGAFLWPTVYDAVTPGVAHADKTVTYLSAGVVMDSMTFGNAGGGNVSASVCAHAKIQGAGADGPVVCESITLPPTDATAIAVTNLAVNNGLPFWKTRQGL
jgi:hypothetical protein